MATIRTFPRPVTISGLAVADSRLSLAALGLLVCLVASDGIDAATAHEQHPDRRVWQELVDLGYLTGTARVGWIVNDEPRR